MKIKLEFATLKNLARVKQWGFVTLVISMLGLAYSLAIHAFAADIAREYHWHVASLNVCFDAVFIVVLLGSLLRLVWNVFSED